MSLPTPFYDEGGITIYCGDCREIAPKLSGIDAVISDPPYGIAWSTKYEGKEGTLTFSHLNGSAPYAKNMVRKKHPPIFGDDKPFDPSPWLTYPIVLLWGANHFSNRLPQGSWLVWDKRDTSGNAFMSEAEAAWMNRGKSVRLVKHCWQGFSRASENSEHYHPTQKPVAVMTWCLDAAKVEAGATILDPFMGSGTTLVAAKLRGLKAVGIEINKDYCEAAVARLSQGVLLPC